MLHCKHRSSPPRPPNPHPKISWVHLFIWLHKENRKCSNTAEQSTYTQTSAASFLGSEPEAKHELSRIRSGRPATHHYSSSEELQLPAQTCAIPEERFCTPPQRQSLPQTGYLRRCVRGKAQKKICKRINGRPSAEDFQFKGVVH